MKSKWLKAVAIYQILGALVGFGVAPLSIIAGAVFPFILMVALAALGLWAGILLVNERRTGLKMSVWVQGIQIPQIQTPLFTLSIYLGFHVDVGLEYQTISINVNLLALALFIYLVRALLRGEDSETKVLSEAGGAVRGEAIRLDPQDAAVYKNRGRAYDDMGEYDEAIVDYSEGIQLDPKYVDAYNEEGEYDRAIADYTNAIRLAPESAPAYSNIAWLLATCPDAKHRDGRRAIDNATKACELSQWANAHCLDTLAAAYAEAGQFEDAIKWQEKAIELWPADFDKTAIESRVELYRAGKPYREEKE